MPDARTPEEVAGGFINVWLGGTQLELPTLKLKAERAWRDALTRTVGDMGYGVDFDALKRGGEDAYGALTPLFSAPSEVVLELVLKYDSTEALGQREWLEDNADSAQLYVVLKKILGVVFPFVEDLRGALLELAGLVDQLVSARSSSMSGPLPTGDSAPTSLSEPSTLTSFSGSGKHPASVKTPRRAAS